MVCDLIVPSPNRLTHRPIGSDIIYVEFFGNQFIILNSTQVADDLLGKRSAIYSDRPAFIFWREMYAWRLNFHFLAQCRCLRLGWEGSLSLLPYGDMFRRHRRLVQDHFKIRLSEYYPLQELEVASFMNDLLKTPDPFLRHTKRSAVHRRDANVEIKCQKQVFSWVAYESYVWA